MAKVKYVVGVILVIAICSAIWFFHPANGQVKQLEENISVLKTQVGELYITTNYSLNRTAEKLIAWDYKQPINDDNEETFTQLYEEVFDIQNVLFYGNLDKLLHRNWENRMSDVRSYLRDYLYGSSLSEEDIDDLHQGLQAIRFIAMDYIDIVQYDRESAYDAMHDEQHEMVERVKSRLTTKY